MPETEWQLAESQLGRALWLVALVSAVAATVLSERSELWQFVLLAVLWGVVLSRAVGDSGAGIEGFLLRGPHWYLLVKGRELPVRLQSYHFWCRELGVLTFVLPGGRTRRVGLLPDSMSEESFWRLSIALRA